MELFKNKDYLLFAVTIDKEARAVTVSASSISRFCASISEYCRVPRYFCTHGQCVAETDIVMSVLPHC